MSAPRPPFDRPGEWRAKVTLYRDDIAIATADAILTDPGEPLDLGDAAHLIGCVVELEAELTARGRREQRASESALHAAAARPGQLVLDLEPGGSTP